MISINPATEKFEGNRIPEECRRIDAEKKRMYGNIDCDDAVCPDGSEICKFCLNCICESKTKYIC